MKSDRLDWSVVIPTYNRADLLMRCLDSVLQQTLNDLEVIIVDDGSSDNTEDAVRACTDDRIIYVRHDRNIGAAAARNTGMSATRGQFIAFLDSDDEWNAEKLQRCQEFAMLRNGGTGWIAFHQTAVQGVEYQSIEPSLALSDSPSFADFLIMDGFIQTSTVFGPRDAVLNVQFDQSYAPLEDWDWLMKQVAVGTAVHYLAQCLSTHYADARPGRLSAVVDPSVSSAWLKDHESELSTRAKAGFELLRIAPSLKQPRPLEARKVALGASVRLWRDLPRIWRPLLAILLPSKLVEQLVRR